MPHRVHLIQALADGRFHSGEELGASLRVSRAAVWKAMKGLARLGLDVHAVPGRGYRLARPVELLDAAAIRAGLAAEALPLLSRLEVLAEVDSTNEYLLRCAAQGAASGQLCLAERQTLGRGRRGRSWVSPFAANLYLSALWRFSLAPAALGGLSLALGVAVHRALQRAGLEGIGLKWPNDLVFGDRKLGGILLELRGESSGPCTVVVGVGLNVHMPPEAGALIDQPWVDLCTVAGDRPPSRNWLAALVVGELLTALRRFDAQGFTPFREEWQRWDAVHGREIELHLHDRRVRGRAAGVDATGALMLAREGKVETYAAGEIGLRLAL
jgi:BirA family transcriptional regulator, biotin operon repressor / biotin---[acetyl-CoA-carboxylase] ligase